MIIYAGIIKSCAGIFFRLQIYIQKQQTVLLTYYDKEIETEAADLNTWFFV